MAHLSEKPGGGGLACPHDSCDENEGGLAHTCLPFSVPHYEEGPLNVPGSDLPLSRPRLFLSIHDAQSETLSLTG